MMTKLAFGLKIPIACMKEDHMIYWALATKKFMYVHVFGVLLHCMDFLVLWMNATLLHNLKYKLGIDLSFIFDMLHSAPSRIPTISQPSSVEVMYSCLGLGLFVKAI